MHRRCGTSFINASAVVTARGSGSAAHHSVLRCARNDNMAGHMEKLCYAFIIVGRCPSRVELASVSGRAPGTLSGIGGSTNSLVAPCATRGRNAVRRRHRASFVDTISTSPIARGHPSRPPARQGGAVRRRSIGGAGSGVPCWRLRKPLSGRSGRDRGALRPRRPEAREGNLTGELERRSTYKSPRRALLKRPQTGLPGLA